MLEQVQHLTRI